MRTRFLAQLTATLSTVAFLGISSPAKALDLFGTDKIQFDEDTDVWFNFEDSHGAYTSILKLFQVGPENSLTEVSTIFRETKGSDNWGDNGWLGTCGNTVDCASNLVQHTLKKGVEYTLGLSSTLSWDASVNGSVYSTSSLNPDSSQQFLFGSWGATGADTTEFDPINYQSADPLAGLVKIAIDDRGNGNDKDFQDIRLTAIAKRKVVTPSPEPSPSTSAKSVPEPSALVAIGLATVGMLSRRRRVS